MGCVPFCQRTEPSPAGLPAGPSSSQEGWMAGSSPAMTDRALPDRRAARADECRGVAERAGLFEPLGEVLHARFVRALTWRRPAAQPVELALLPQPWLSPGLRAKASRRGSTAAAGGRGARAPCDRS